MIDKTHIKEFLKKYSRQTFIEAHIKLARIFLQDDLKIERDKENNPKILERLNKLYRNGFYVEMIILGSQLIEKAVKDTIRAFEIVQITDVILSDLNNYKNYEIKFTNCDQPLGFLVEKLAEQTCGTEETLIMMLRNYNQDYRIKYVHDFVYGLEGFDVLDKQAKEYVEIDNPGKRFTDLLGEIGRVRVGVQKSINRKAAWLTEIPLKSNTADITKVILKVIEENNQ